ncbi:PREDICTED: mediator of RNA polymerase II transcription subunit 20 [Ceratosolen solmsi marchali]|uniref:Mediator of RNA polymerase II transcription subunit 20 n=1 Tax=Ceratosolen solmsi marchali TaxID=326594 RepID=A0AAJ7DZY7_9HYME|nr:PREDICTED: mediator of RNA polymerase II transcription subunit 20 [Ceratosolen solmsi marchali]
MGTGSLGRTWPAKNKWQIPGGYENGENINSQSLPIPNQKNGGQRTVHVLHNSEQPASVFAILEYGNKVVPLIADRLFDLVILKMTNVCTDKKQTKIECKGPRFELVDFCIKLGSVTMTQNFKGVLVEIEYRPSVVPANCWELIREFVQGFLGSAVSSQIPQYLQNRMNEIYQPMDTIHQYLEHFGQYRKSTGVI